MPHAILAKCQSMLQAIKQKLLFYGLSNAQIESIKGKKQISPYTTFIVLTADIFEIAATEGSYVMEGAAIIKLAALSTFWLESQVNVSNAKSLKIGQSYGFLYGLSYQEVEATISFINRKSI
jgi:Cu(I)/Ag(I) efflux system membrane fusion protein